MLIKPTFVQYYAQIGVLLNNLELLMKLHMVSDSCLSLIND